MLLDIRIYVNTYVKNIIKNNTYQCRMVVLLKTIN